ncbi:MAG: hypothetical protein PHW40_00895 [Candidatus Izemoplasmatales bacterium]|jgi:hypothetical protein|nr:hypothetical protein [Candidatus Izemoplasmatales bacterium]
MEKIASGIIVIVLFGFLVSSSVEMRQLFEFIGTIIQFAAAVVKGIVQIFITIVEALL